MTDPLLLRLRAWCRSRRSRVEGRERRCPRGPAARSGSLTDRPAGVGRSTLPFGCGGALDASSALPAMRWLPVELGEPFPRTPPSAVGWRRELCGGPIRHGIRAVCARSACPRARRLRRCRDSARAHAGAALARGDDRRRDRQPGSRGAARGRRGDRQDAAARPCDPARAGERDDRAAGARRRAGAPVPVRRRAAAVRALSVVGLRARAQTRARRRCGARRPAAVGRRHRARERRAGIPAPARPRTGSSRTSPSVSRC